MPQILNIYNLTTTLFFPLSNVHTVYKQLECLPHPKKCIQSSPEFKFVDLKLWSTVVCIKLWTLTTVLPLVASMATEPILCSPLDNHQERACWPHPSARTAIFSAPISSSHIFSQSTELTAPMGSCKLLSIFSRGSRTAKVMSMLQEKPDFLK